MASRFTNTNKYKSPFYRGLQGAYKGLWDYLYHDCDHAGLWPVDFEIAQICVGKDLPINETLALSFFNENKTRVIVLDEGRTWFIPSFIEHQYKGVLNVKNRVHESIINSLNKYGLLSIFEEAEGARGEKIFVLKNEFEFFNKKNKPLTSPLQGAKEYGIGNMDKDKEKDGGMGETILPNIHTGFDVLLVPEMMAVWKQTRADYVEDKYQDFPALRAIGERIAKGKQIDDMTTRESVATIKQTWQVICNESLKMDHERNYTLEQVNRYFNSITSKIKNKAAEPAGKVASIVSTHTKALEILKNQSYGNS